MDKESYQLMTIGHVAMRGDKRRAFISIFAGSGSGEGESRFFQKWRVFRERKWNSSLDFPAFEPSVRVGPRSKVVLR